MYYVIANTYCILTEKFGFTFFSLQSPKHFLIAGCKKSEYFLAHLLFLRPYFIRYTGSMLLLIIFEIVMSYDHVIDQILVLNL